MQIIPGAGLSLWYLLISMKIVAEHILSGMLASWEQQLLHLNKNKSIKHKGIVLIFQLDTFINDITTYCTTAHG